MALSLTSPFPEKGLDLIIVGERAYVTFWILLFYLKWEVSSCSTLTDSVGQEVTRNDSNAKAHLIVFYFPHFSKHMVTYLYNLYYTQAIPSVPPPNVETIPYLLTKHTPRLVGRRWEYWRVNIFSLH
jgi:hypothetical protein